MDETDEMKSLRDRLRLGDEDQSDDVLRTIESDSWEHLRATTEMDSTLSAETARHEVPPELLEASIPTREHRAVMPRPDDPRWLDVFATVGDDGQLALPEGTPVRLTPGRRVLVRILSDE